MDLALSVTEADDLMKKLSLEPKTKTHDAAEVPKKVNIWSRFIFL